jgi:hypothetical protein
MTGGSDTYPALAARMRREDGGGWYDDDALMRSSRSKHRAVAS